MDGFSDPDDESDQREDTDEDQGLAVTHHLLHVFECVGCGKKSSDASVDWMTEYLCTPCWRAGKRGEPAVMVRGVIPGDGRRFPDWPTPTGFKLARAVTFGGA